MPMNLAPPPVPLQCCAPCPPPPPHMPPPPPPHTSDATQVRAARGGVAAPESLLGELLDARPARGLDLLVGLGLVLALVLCLTVGEDLAVERDVTHERRMSPVGHDPARVEHDHPLGEADRRQPVGDDQGGPPLHQR